MPIISHVAASMTITSAATVFAIARPFSWGHAGTCPIPFVRGLASLAEGGARRGEGVYLMILLTSDYRCKKHPGQMPWVFQIVKKVRLIAEVYQFAPHPRLPCVTAQAGFS